MSTAARPRVAVIDSGSDETVTTRRLSGAGDAPRLATPAGSALAEFEQIYRRNVDTVMAYFARRCAEPQTVADLTSDTFVRAAGAFSSFDRSRGSARVWLFGIAGHVFARHCERAATGREAVSRLAGRRALQTDEIEELAARIDAERVGRELMKRCSQLPELERDAIELVDLMELTPKEAAATLGVSRVVLRKRLSRARARLRKEHQSDE
jgi:RNA polymerase sigma-70 factor (ECF subfamily)